MIYAVGARRQRWWIYERSLLPTVKRHFLQLIRNEFIVTMKCVCRRTALAIGNKIYRKRYTCRIWTIISHLFPTYSDILLLAAVGLVKDLFTMVRVLPREGQCHYRNLRFNYKSYGFSSTVKYTYISRMFSIMGKKD